MKLGILCTMLNGFGKKGFYNSQEIGLGRQLVKDGHTVVIYKGVPMSKLKRVTTDICDPKIRIIYIPMPGLGVHGFLNTGLLDRDLDGLLCFTDNQLFTPHIIRFCKKNNIRIIPYFGTTLSMYKSLRGRVINCLFGTFTAPYYRNMRVMAKTRGVCAELHSVGIRNIIIAPAGIDFSILRQDFQDHDRNQLRSEYGYEPDDIVLFSVARMEMDKRPQDMVKILNKIKNRKKFKLLIVGKGPLREKVDRLILQYNLSDKVRIIESVPYEEMWKFYRIADYFLNLNKEEIFGMAIMESVFYCVPVLAVTAPGPSSTLRGMKGHFLCRDDNEIAELLCGDYPEQSDLNTSADKAVKRYSWKKTAGILAALAAGGR